jgi:hypothetical protein
LAQKFGSLAAEMAGAADPDDAQIHKWSEKIRAIEVQEPPLLTVFVQASQNQIAVADGQPDKVYTISPWRWMLAFFGLDTAVRGALGTA